MTAVEQVPAPVGTSSSIKRFAGIVAIYVLVGPPVGGAVLWIMAMAGAVWHDRMPASAIALLLTAVGFSYPFGAPLALVAGLIDAIAAIGLRYTSVGVPVLAACLTSAAITAVTHALMPNPAGSGFWGTMLVMLGAALVCWRLTRRFARTA